MKRVFIVIAGLVLSTTAFAQNDREGMWEFGLLVNDMSSETLRGNQGSAIQTDSSTGYGISLGYNFNNRWALSGDITWNTPDYLAILIPDDGIGAPEVIEHELDVIGYMFKGTFNFFESPVTPYVEAAFGWTKIDSNVADGPPLTDCWWDPWWGYVCDTFYSTYDKTRETLGGTAGIRWDLNNGMTLKGSYGILDIDTSKATESANIEVYRIDVMWLF